MLAIMICTLIGSVYCVLAINTRFQLAFPDYFVEKYGKASSVDVEDPNGVSNGNARIIFFLAVLFVVICCG